MLALHRITRAWRGLAALAACALLVAGSVNAQDSDAEELDEFGAVSAHGDFNGDGYQDVAIGAPQESLDALSAGAVDVIYGGPGGLDRANRQFWNLDVADVEGEAMERDGFGGALAAGDFNADGYDDLAVGVPGAMINGSSAAGAVNVLYGSPSGLSARAVPDQRWNQDSPDVDDVAAPFDQFGWALATGDFNADGYADLAIGVPEKDVGTRVDAGVVNVLYGSAAGLSATAVPDQRWTQNVRGVKDVVEAHDLFGAALTAGDFNGDGYSDLAIGVPDETVVEADQAGLVNVLYGSVAGLTATALPDQRWHQDVAAVEGVAAAFDHFGSSLASGDFNADGYDDLAIGVPEEDIGDAFDAGAVNVIYGSVSGLSATAVPDQRWHQDVNNVEDVAEANDLFGSALAVADFNADGCADLAIGVPKESVSSKAYAGSVNVLYGATSGLSAVAVADQSWNQDAADVEDVAEELDYFAYSLTAADFNADGYADLAIGVPLENLVCFSGAIDNAGAVSVLYGAVAGLSATAVRDQFWTQPCP